MTRFHTFLAAVLLALASLGVQAQANRADDDLAIDTPAGVQPRAERGARGGGGNTLRDVRQAMRDGDLPRARSMVDAIVQKEPNNARAHFVKAQLASRDRDLATARAELQEAERLAPGLPFAREQAVTNLRTRLERLETREARGAERPRAGRNGDAARPAQVPPGTQSSNDTGSTTAGASAGSGGAAVETRPAGEETRNMGAPARKEEAGGTNSLVLGIAIGAVIAVVAAALFFRRRPPQA